MRWTKARRNIGAAILLVAVTVVSVAALGSGPLQLPAAALNQVQQQHSQVHVNSVSLKPIWQLKQNTTSVSSTRTYTVKSGDSLSVIAKRLYGKSADWTFIYYKNKRKIADPNSLLVGQRLVIPVPHGRPPAYHWPVIATPLAQASPVSSGGGGGSPTPVSGAAGQAVAYAYAQLGCPYVYGGNGPCNSGYDCSGLMQQAWSSAGVSIPRISYDIMSQLTAVSTHSLEPGDILGMYGNGHVGMYVGNGMMIDAPVPGQNVEKIAVPWGAVDGAVRP